MQRITVSIDDGLAETFDSMIAERAYSSRSEAVRDLVRDAVERWRSEAGATVHCVATLSYVYDRRVRSLAERLSAIEHDHHDRVALSATIRLDHDHSLTSVMLKGETEAVRAVIDLIVAQRGVRSARVNLIAVQPDDDHGHDHDHGPAHHHHGQKHLSPLTE